MACKNVVLHFGMDKTGSSSIRASLTTNLADPAFYFARPKSTDAGQWLAAAFKDDPLSFYQFKRLGLRPGAIPQLRTDAFQALTDELNKADGKTAIISSEAVSRFNTAECSRLLNFLLSFSDSVRAVGYVRQPKAYMESAFQQKIKASRTCALLPKSLMPHYRKRFKAIDDGFGRDRVDLWLFNPSSFAQSDVVLDFCQKIGIRFDAASVVRTNAGLSRRAISLLFAYRKFGHPQAEDSAFLQENRLLIRELQRIKGPKLRFHSSLVANAIEAERDTIDWMSRRLGAPMTEDLAAHDSEAIRSEDDLLDVPSQATRWLAKRLGPEYEDRWVERMAPDLVAEWMDQFQKRLITANATQEADARAAT